MCRFCALQPALHDVQYIDRWTGDSTGNIDGEADLFRDRVERHMNMRKRQAEATENASRCVNVTLCVGKAAERATLPLLPFYPRISLAAHETHYAFESRLYFCLLLLCLSFLHAHCWSSSLVAGRTATHCPACRGRSPVCRSNVSRALTRHDVADIVV
jgi:hypothetical protein